APRRARRGRPRRADPRRARDALPAHPRAARARGGLADARHLRVGRPARPAAAPPRAAGQRVTRTVNARVARKPARETPTDPDTDLPAERGTRQAHVAVAPEKLLFASARGIF